MAPHHSECSVSHTNVFVSATHHIILRDNNHMLLLLLNQLLQRIHLMSSHTLAHTRSQHTVDIVVLTQSCVTSWRRSYNRGGDVLSNSLQLSTKKCWLWDTYYINWVKNIWILSEWHIFVTVRINTLPMAEGDWITNEELQLNINATWSVRNAAHRKTIHPRLKSPGQYFALHQLSFCYAVWIRWTAEIKKECTSPICCQILNCVAHKQHQRHITCVFHLNWRKSDGEWRNAQQVV